METMKRSRGPEPDCPSAAATPGELQGGGDNLTAGAAVDGAAQRIEVAASGEGGSTADLGSRLAMGVRGDEAAAGDGEPGWDGSGSRASQPTREAQRCAGSSGRDPAPPHRSRLRSEQGSPGQREPVLATKMAGSGSGCQDMQVSIHAHVAGSQHAKRMHR
ncbi:unnamed protein product [Triticum turgidum subsp. durum]|uniref:Uncharacterized protein n=1 Tax=Triticum turgidum subsp. durum TaxID=4567 RepID=A0A9R1AVU5_TRITD|nr:unnamed protein product [Triticum turgidum subsp. durum]